MTNEEAISVIENEIQIDVRLCIDEQVERFQEALYKAIDALRSRTTGEPLTLDQLREMDGQPVWIERIGSDSPEEKEWALVFCKEKFCRTSRGNVAMFWCYGIGWLAYAYPPDSIDREAWEPCELCSMPDGTPAKHLILAETCNGEAKYCPECGRPLTPEAWGALGKRLRG